MQNIQKNCFFNLAIGDGNSSSQTSISFLSAAGNTKKIKTLFLFHFFLLEEILVLYKEL